MPPTAAVAAKARTNLRSPRRPGTRNSVIEIHDSIGLDDANDSVEALRLPGLPESPGCPNVGGAEAIGKNDHMGRTLVVLKLRCTKHRGQPLPQISGAGEVELSQDSIRLAAAGFHSGRLLSAKGKLCQKQKAGYNAQSDSSEAIYNDVHNAALLIDPSTR
jgi:hypothetical protein